jgi:subtilisin family serine protease
MLITRKNAKRLSIALVVALLVNLNFLTFAHIVNAAPAGKASKPRKAEKISSRLKSDAHTPDEKVTVLVALNGPVSGRLNAFLNRNGVKRRREMKKMSSNSVNLPFRSVAELASFPEVFHVASNENVISLGHVTTTTGGEPGQTAAANAGRGSIDGSGMSIAILDSGIDVNHAQFAAVGGGSRVIASVDFTGENRTDDPYGHGTFVAAAAAGGAGAGAAYKGIATGVSLVNVRVLNSSGVGTVENVLEGLNWVALHAREYNIRIVNLSLGTHAVESYKYDALCRAVRALVNSGILVFAAAGNDGKDENGQKIYGSIHSPGNEPSAITVGATNTLQTDQRSDDEVTTFSSRGPTRSFWMDTDGVKHHDNILKPDLVAPGNKLVFAQSNQNLLVTTNPTLNESSAGTASTMKLMRMSGTSAATPIAAGAAALMLQLNPKMTPNMVKAFMEYSAQKLDDFGVLEQGAGQLNIEGAMRLAQLVRQDLSSPVPVGLPLLTDSITPSSSFATSPFDWSGMILRKFNTMSGTALITRFQGPYFSGELLGDGFLLSDGMIVNR